jgi:hypothetical protein
MGVSVVPQARWMVYFMENPVTMDDLGVTHFRNPPYTYIYIIYIIYIYVYIIYIY